jgi:hypothetical protein
LPRRESPGMLMLSFTGILLRVGLLCPGWTNLAPKTRRTIRRASGFTGGHSGTQYVQTSSPDSRGDETAPNSERRASTEQQFAKLLDAPAKQVNDLLDRLRCFHVDAGSP